MLNLARNRTLARRYSDRLLGNVLYRALFSRWPPPSISQEGYTLLLPVPGDLPVFLKVVLDVVGRQDPEHRVETLVIPDLPTKSFMEAAARALPEFRGGPIRTVRSPTWIDRWLVGRGNPGLNCWLQFHRGVSQARATHVLFHDADLFIGDPQFLRRHYEQCCARKLACLGVNESWDEWYRRNGFGHTVATWELVLQVAWARQFAPWQHRGHEGELLGKTHVFDVTMLPQCLTPPSLIGRSPGSDHLVHFGYVIGTYRLFQRARPPFEDSYFRIVLIRLLIDAFDPEGSALHRVPTMKMILDGLEERPAPVSYRDPATARHYAEFRSKLQELIENQGLDASVKEGISRGIRPFDAVFGG